MEVSTEKFSSNILEKLRRVKLKYIDELLSGFKVSDFKEIYDIFYDMFRHKRIWWSLFCNSQKMGDVVDGSRVKRFGKQN